MILNIVLLRNSCVTLRPNQVKPNSNDHQINVIKKIALVEEQNYCNEYFLIFYDFWQCSVMLYNVLGCSTTLRLNVEKYFYVSREIVSNNRFYLKLFHRSISLFYFRLVLSTRCPIKKIQLLTTTNDFFGTVCRVQTEIDINRWGLKDVKINPSWTRVCC